MFFPRCISPPKNGDELFWEQKFHAANGKAQAFTQGALLSCLLGFEREGRNFLYFPQVPKVFPLCSLQVPNRFTSGSKFVPQVLSVLTKHVLQSTSSHFYPMCLGKCCPPFTCIGGPKGKNSILQNRTFYFGSVHSFIFLE